MRNFQEKIKGDREYSSPGDLEWALESDRGRIINAAPIRRLQQKTQVFPLERNAAVRSRLTHSLEVQQNGRFITREVFRLLAGAEQDFGLKAYAREVESLVEMACLMHDMGNPPFGHFGEAAISAWFAKELPQLEVFKTEEASKLTHELQTFEGNAQAIRIVASLQKLNLTYAQTASILKYTRAGTEEKPGNDDPLLALKKKPGYYHSERDFVHKMQAALTIEPGHRYPLVYIMEAADDISYCLADLEDGVDKGLLNVTELAQALQSTFEKLRGPYGDAEVAHFGGKSFADLMAQATDSDRQSFFIKFRVGFIHPLVQHAARAFVDNLPAIYDGRFPHGLLEDNSPAHAVVQSLKNVAVHYVFRTHEVETLELQGYQVLTGILDKYAPLLHLNKGDFQKLVATGKCSNVLATLLLRRIPGELLRTYKEHCAELSREDEVLELYYRCRLLQDVVSGLTDQLALDEYQTLHAMGHY
ncbi:dGTPase [Aliidiomarina taiwanensis]|uniref:dGTPase n=1 Tax=Aliidiomarina taiwanensis TaxID=946228 RepID=A0A432X0Y8_9GAMM|nr:dGTPase [Aliidiomarina taiwanensis]RUO39824.1 dGTPase [Aliidiomarina taiwanensis]